jgi:hypothetical protein
VVRRLMFNTICLAVLLVTWSVTTDQALRADQCCVVQSDCNGYSDHEICQDPLPQDQDCRDAGQGSCYNQYNQHCVGTGSVCYSNPDCCFDTCNAYYLCGNNGNPSCRQNGEPCQDYEDCCVELTCEAGFCIPRY